MKNNQTSEYNTELRNKPALEIVRWGIARANGHAMVSTNFRPFEAVVLHLRTQVQPDIPVLWVDHGHNRSVTYRHAEKLRDMLHLNLKIYLPKLTAAHRDAIYDPIPSFYDETELKKFSAMMKLEPFQHGMKELVPTVWLLCYAKYKTRVVLGWTFSLKIRVMTQLKLVLFSIGPDCVKTRKFGSK